MKIICPKCQYENQADSSRIVCARCATIIEVKQDQGTGVDSNGRRQTARLPFVGNVGNSQPLNNPLNNPASNPSSSPSQDVYATRVGDDFDDVLDIPRQTQPSYSSGNEPATAFEDVFAMPNYDSPANYDFPPQEKKPTAPIDGFPTGQGRQRSTQDYGAAPEPEFMGWPVLPENGDDDQEQVNSLSTNRGALLARVGLGVVVFGLLSFLAYYFLSDKIAKRQEGHPSGAASSETGAGKTGTAPTYPPATVPSLENKQPEAKPSAPVSSKPADSTQQAESKPQIQTPSKSNDAAKAVPIVPLPAGKSEHIVPKPAPPTKQSVPAAPGKGSLTIQVASFSDKAQADERVARLRQFNAEARVVQAEVNGKTWYRVQIGGFKSREEAANQASQLKGKGAIQDFIITTVGK